MYDLKEQRRKDKWWWQEKSSPACCWTQTLASTVWARKSINNLKDMSGGERSNNKNPTSAQQLSSSFPLWIPLPPSHCFSIPLSLHTHTQSLTTPFLSSSVLFDRCHGDYKDTRISWWGSGTERRKCACFKDLSVEFLWYHFLKFNLEFVLPVQLNSSPIMLGDKYPLESHWRRPLSKEVRHDDHDANKPEVLLNYYRFHITSVYDSHKHNIK